MRKKNLIQITLGLICLIIFVLFTISLEFVDVQPIGPNESVVAYATINGTVHEFIGVNMMLYNITDWAGLVPIFVLILFASIGLVQWIKRRNLLKVDISIFLLGMYYLIVFAVYIFFETVVINCRPVLINGKLEASYPSSTTLLAMSVMPTAIVQAKRMLSNKLIYKIVIAFCVLFEIFMVVGRFFSGVHWFTDIFAASVFSTGILLIYNGLNNDIF